VGEKNQQWHHRHIIKQLVYIDFSKSEQTQIERERYLKEEAEVPEHDFIANGGYQNCMEFTIGSNEDVERSRSTRSRRR
jgi:hypothetical protein